MKAASEKSGSSRGLAGTPIPWSDRRSGPCQSPAEAPTGGGSTGALLMLHLEAARMLKAQVEGCLASVPSAEDSRDALLSYIQERYSTCSAATSQRVIDLLLSLVKDGGVDGGKEVTIEVEDQPFEVLLQIREILDSPRPPSPSSFPSSPSSSASPSASISSSPSRSPSPASSSSSVGRKRRKRKRVSTGSRVSTPVAAKKAGTKKGCGKRRGTPVPSPPPSSKKEDAEEVWLEFLTGTQTRSSSSLSSIKSARAAFVTHANNASLETPSAVRILGTYLDKVFGQRKVPDLPFSPAALGKHLCTDYGTTAGVRKHFPKDIEALYAKYEQKKAAK